MYGNISHSVAAGSCACQTLVSHPSKVFNSYDNYIVVEADFGDLLTSSGQVGFLVTDVDYCSNITIIPSLLSIGHTQHENFWYEAELFDWRMEQGYHHAYQFRTNVSEVSFNIHLHV